MTNSISHFDPGTVADVFDRFSRMRVLIIGDVMIDSYLWGTVDRISPEAPVPVVAVNRRNNRLGGAANVALNVKSLGAEAMLCSIVGRDPKGGELLHLLRDEGLDNQGVVELPDRITTTKFRIFGNRSQILRVDEEVTEPLSKTFSMILTRMITDLMQQQKWDVVIFQDYDKGMITPLLIDPICTLAKQLGIPVAADPKRRNFNAYRNIRLFKPNLKEFREGMKSDLDPHDQNRFQEAIDQLHADRQIDQVLITLSSEGVYISDHGTGTLLPAHLRNIADVSGAGDTVISVAAMGMAAGLTPVQYAALGNLAGGLVCEEAGVVPVDSRKLREETLRLLV